MAIRVYKPGEEAKRGECKVEKAEYQLIRHLKTLPLKVRVGIGC